MEILSVSPELICHIDHNLPITKNVYELFLGFLNGRLIGYLIIGKDNNGYNLEHLFIDEKYRQNGFGTQLLKLCIDTYNHLKLMVSTENNVAIKLYEKYGFKKSYSNRNYHVMVK